MLVVAALLTVRPGQALGWEEVRTVPIHSPSRRQAATLLPEPVSHWAAHRRRHSPQALLCSSLCPDPPRPPLETAESPLYLTA